MHLLVCLSVTALGEAPAADIANIGPLSSVLALVGLSSPFIVSRQSYPGVFSFFGVKDQGCPRSKGDAYMEVTRLAEAFTAVGELADLGGTRCQLPGKALWISLSRYARHHAYIWPLACVGSDMGIKLRLLCELLLATAEVAGKFPHSSLLLFRLALMRR